MRKEKLLKLLKQAKGEIFGEVSNFNDVFHVKLVKADLVATIEDSFQPNEETGFVANINSGAIWFGKDYEAH